MSFNFVKENFKLGGEGSGVFNFYKRSFILGAGGAPSPTWQDIIISGNTALTLVNAKANGLEYLKLFGKCGFIPENYIDSVTLYGKCSQSSTPTPSTPVDIVCNNGVIKCNRVINRYSGSINSSGEIINNSNYAINVAPVEPNKTYTVYGMSVYALFTELPVMGSASYNGSRVISGTNSVTIPNDSTIKYIAIRTTTETLGAFYSNDELIYTDGTVETVTDDVGNTATAEMLLKVGNYTDEQSIIDGAINRKVGAIVLDGTESWSYDSTYERFTVTITDLIKGLSNRRMPLICSHYPVISDGRNIANVPYNSIYGTNTNSVFIKTADYTTEEGFTGFLAQQYSNGTPVILVYPLNEATTTAAFGQELHKTPITVAGALSDLEYDVVNSVHTQPYPLQPLKISCNNGVIGTGRNIFDQSVFNTDVGSTVTYLQYPVVNGTYTMSTNSPAGGTSSNLANVFFMAGNITTGGISHSDNGVWVNKPISITVSDGYYTVAYRTSSTSNTYNPADYNWQIESGSTATAYEPYATIKVTGTTETVEVDRTGDTATAEMLLSCGTYKDEQEILTGTVKRSVGVKVLTGNENWTKTSSGNKYISLRKTDFAVVPPTAGATDLFCTHFTNVGLNYDSQIGMGFGANYLNINLNNSTSITTTQLKQWLADQFNAGTPVIVVYRAKNTATTTVTGQPLSIARGVNNITITQSSIEGLRLEAKYKAGVTVTVTEVENANLDDSVTVTIGE